MFLVRSLKSVVLKGVYRKRILERGLKRSTVEARMSNRRAIQWIVFIRIIRLVGFPAWTVSDKHFNKATLLKLFIVFQQV